MRTFEYSRFESRALPAAAAGGLFSPGAQAAKRLLDLTVAGLLLALGWPLLLLIGLLVRLDSPGPALFVQARLGRGGRPFRLLKFRTMQAAPRPGLEAHLLADPASRQEWDRYQKLRQDPRLTRLGRVLRRYSLDELPQLWNVLVGEMSLVGPRPFFAGQREAYQAACAEAYAGYVRLRPGLTGLWQVSGRNRLTFEQRASWDGVYVRTWSPRLEALILKRTVGVVLRGEGF